jgi:hypothetical protein
MIAQGNGSIRQGSAGGYVPPRALHPLAAKRPIPLGKLWTVFLTGPAQVEQSGAGQPL